jgi:putative ABC transport system permease protein
MIPTAYIKVWRDLWRNKGRTVLVVLSITTGVTAVGMIFSGNSRMMDQMSRAHIASQPAHITMWLNGRVDDDVIHSLTRIENVEAADGISDWRIRWKPDLDAVWQDADIYTIRDYEAQSLDLIEIRSGTWPESRSVAVAWNHVLPYGIPDVGETIYFEVNGRPHPMTISGTVRDPTIAAPPFNLFPAMYVTMRGMERLAGVQGFDRIRLSLPEFSTESAEVVADAVTDKLERQGLAVGYTLIQPPDRHWAQDQVEGVGLILAVLAVASLFLSVVLVINTINALMVQQIPQIGIMKTIGGRRQQITKLYLAGVLAYGAFSLLIAIPLGAFAGHKLSAWILDLINIPAEPLALHPGTVMIQIGAGLLVPLLAGLWPILRGVSISVAQAISQYGLGTGRYGMGRIDRLLNRIRGLPRMLTLSVRNTFRKLSRVALTQLVLISAGAIFMMVLSTQYSFSKTIEEIWHSLGFDALIIFSQDQRIDEIVPLIESRPNVDLVEMWLWATATARVPGSDDTSEEERVYLRAIPKQSQLFTPKLTDGRDIDPMDGHALLLNQKLAKDMKLQAGDKIELDFMGYGTSIWTIVGLVFDLTSNQSTAYAHFDTLAEELNHIDRASVAEVHAHENGPASELALTQDIKEFLDDQGYEISYTQTASEDRENAESQFQIITNVLLIMTVLMAIVGSIGLSGTLSINVLERRREIGVMRAVGASSRDIAFIFICEGLILGIFSWLQAIPLSFLMGQPFMNAISEIVNLPSQYQMAVQSIWIWLIIVIILSLAASWIPTRRAMRVSVNESLSYE